MNIAKILARGLLMCFLVIFLSGPVFQVRAAEGDPTSGVAVVPLEVEKTEANKAISAEAPEGKTLPVAVKQIKNQPPAKSDLPGAKWWIPSKPYKLWKKDHLQDRLRRLEAYKAELTKAKGDSTTVAEVDEQIKQVKTILARIW